VAKTNRKNVLIPGYIDLPVRNCHGRASPVARLGALALKKDFLQFITGQRLFSWMTSAH
jgi:hypothetical protein